MKNHQKLSKQFIKDAHSIFNTEIGIRFLAYLRQEFLDTSVIGADPYQTYYNAGWEDLIKLFISYSSQEMLDKIDLSTSGVEEYNYGR